MEKSKFEKFFIFLSVAYILAAVFLLIVVCGRCFPEAGELGRQIMIGREDSPAREAFSVLTDSLEQGNSWQTSVSDAYEVLLGKEN